MTDRGQSLIRNPGSFLPTPPFSILASILKITSWPKMAAVAPVTWSTFHLKETSGNPTGLSHMTHEAVKEAENVFC